MAVHHNCAQMMAHFILDLENKGIALASAVHLSSHITQAIGSTLKIMESHIIYETIYTRLKLYKNNTFILIFKRH